MFKCRAKKNKTITASCQKKKKIKKKKSPNNTIIFFWVMIHFWNRQIHNLFHLLHDSVSDAHKSHKSSVIHRENELRIKNTRVRHSCWLVCLWWCGEFRDPEATEPVAHALVSFPKKNVFSYTISNCLHLIPPPPRAISPLLLYTSVKSTTLVK